MKLHWGDSQFGIRLQPPVLVAGIALASLLALVLVIALGADDASAQANVTRPSTVLSQLANAPAQFEGSSVIAHGQVSRRLGPIAGRAVFTLDDATTRADEQVLVVTRPLRDRQRASLALDAGDTVEVRGRVRILTRAEIRTLMLESDFSLEASALQRFLGRPVILARSINTTPRSARPESSRVDLGTEAGPTGSAVPAAQAGRPQPTTGLTREATERAVTVQGRITDVLDFQAFVLNGEILLVSAEPVALPLPSRRSPAFAEALRRGQDRLLQERIAPLDRLDLPGPRRAFAELPMQGDLVQVTGIVRRFTDRATFEDALRILFIDPRLVPFEAIAGRPVIVATSVSLVSSGATVQGRK